MTPPCHLTTTALLAIQQTPQATSSTITVGAATLMEEPPAQSLMTALFTMVVLINPPSQSTRATLVL